MTYKEAIDPGSYPERIRPIVRVLLKADEVHAMGIHFYLADELHTWLVEQGEELRSAWLEQGADVTQRADEFLQAYGEMEESEES